MMDQSGSASGSPAGLYVTRNGMVVDPRRFITADRHLFTPFQVTSTRPVPQLLAEGLLEDDTQLVAARVGPERRLAFTAQQLAFHHVVQGETDGEPWMVCF